MANNKPRKKDPEDKKGKAYMKNVGESVKKGQSGKSPLSKMNGPTTSEGTGIDPVTNTSYPRKKKK